MLFCIRRPKDAFKLQILRCRRQHLHILPSFGPHLPFLNSHHRQVDLAGDDGPHPQGVDQLEHGGFVRDVVEESEALSDYPGSCH